MSSTHENPNIAKLLEDISAYIGKHGLSKTGFGKEAVNDPSLIADLEEGREPRWKTIQRVREFMGQGRAAS